MTSVGRVELGRSSGEFDVSWVMGGPFACRARVRGKMILLKNQSIACTFDCIRQNSPQFEFVSNTLERNSLVRPDVNDWDRA